MDDYTEGQTATSKDGKSRVVYRSGMWIKDTSYRPPEEKATTSAQDRTELNAASSKAQAERDANRAYSKARQAVEDFDPGPVKARWMDAIYPDEDGGIMDAIGATLGTLARPFVSKKTENARDHLRTINAGVALEGSQQMKGSSSDKDTALMRMAGLSPYKQKAENLRILKEAEYDGGLEAARALLKSKWIGKYGSLSAPSPNGTTFETALLDTERRYDGLRKGKKKPAALPKAPPKTRGRTPTYDINGNLIK